MEEKINNLKQPDKLFVSWKKSLRFRLTAIVVVLSLLAGIAMIVFLAYFYQNRIDMEYKNKAISMSKIAASLLDGETVDRYLWSLEKDDE